MVLLTAHLVQSTKTILLAMHNNGDHCGSEWLCQFTGLQNQSRPITARSIQLYQIHLQWFASHQMPHCSVTTVILAKQFCGTTVVPQKSTEVER